MNKEIFDEFPRFVNPESGAILVMDEIAIIWNVNSLTRNSSGGKDQSERGFVSIYRCLKPVLIREWDHARVLVASN